MNSGKNRIISNVIWKFAERILAQAVSLVVSIVLARILLPEDYGAISMVMVFITIADVFVSEGIPSALIQKKDADELDFSSVFYFNLMVSVGIYFAIFNSAPYIADFYNEPILSSVLKVLGLRIIIAAVNSVQHSYVSRHMIFKKYFWSTLFGTLTSGVVGILMAYMGFGVWSLVAQYMINTTVDTLVLFITVSWRPRWMFSFQRVNEMAKFGWKILFEAVSGTISNQLRNLLIGKIYTSNDLAFFTKGQQFPNLIVTNITSSVAAVLFPAMSNEQDDEERVLLLLRKSVRLSSYVVYPMLFGLGVMATPFISVLLTDKWLDTAPYIQIFCIISLATVAMIPRHQALNSIGKSNIYMYEHIFARVIGLIILFCIFRISVFAIAVSSILSTAILMGTVAYTSKRYNGYKYRDQVVDIVPTINGCVVMSIVLFVVGNLGLSNIVTLCLQVLMGIITYGLYGKCMNIEEYDIGMQYVKSVVGKK